MAHKLNWQKYHGGVECATISVEIVIDRADYDVLTQIQKESDLPSIHDAALLCFDEALSSYRYLFEDDSPRKIGADETGETG